MGCYIHITTEVRRKDLWIKVVADFSNGGAPFDWQSYGLYGFLADVRNYSAIEPIGKRKGLPEDVSMAALETIGEHERHSCSWLSLAELLAVDYTKLIEDRRKTVRMGPNVWDGGGTETYWAGSPARLSEFLGPRFMHDLEVLKTLGKPEDVRIVFCFDN